MTTAQLAMDISDDTGLPLSTVLDMDLETLMWGYPGSEADELEETADADDFRWLDDEVGITADFAADDLLESDITGHTSEEYRRDAWEERYGVSYEDQGDEDDNQEEA